MNLDALMEFVKANPLILMLAYFLFKDKIDPLFSKLFSFLGGGSQPVTVVPPPAVPVVPVVEERPVIDAIMKLLPVILPVVLAQIEKSKAEKASG